MSVSTDPWYLQSRKRQFITGAVLSVIIVSIAFSFLRYQDASRQVVPELQVLPPPVVYKGNGTTPLYDPSKLVFLVETRPIPHLPALFLHMMQIVPPEWQFLFMGSAEAISFMRSKPAILRLESSGRLRIQTIPPEYQVTDRENVSQMFTDIHLYRDIMAPAEHVLVFQPDAIFCTNSEQSLNDYLDWDWIGAPWGAGIQWGGNGGLSLRKISRILQVLEKESRTAGHPELEDLWLTNRMKDLDGAKMPNATISKHFSVESVWDESPMGYHIGWLGVHHPQIWDNEDQVNHILKYCPEVKMILGMKLEMDKPKYVDSSQ
ncbi:hypothetical protein F5884DRAFT_241150 [Xylogone sp. PMI_703]|nr:hypothetical protein F5884DRAFT_241150 [Xylogone sp. PMI_703]